MDDWIWIAIAVAAAVVVLVVLLLAVRRMRRRRRTARLRARFGPEYDTAVRRFGRTEGERHLEDLLARHDRRRVRDLSPEERDAALQSLEAVQTSFVDSPVTALRAADQLVFDVLRERGYPLETLDERASALAVEEPELAHRYRRAHSTLTRADGTDGNGAAGDVGDLREAFVTYRDLLRELVGAPSVPGRLVTAPPAPPAAEPDRRPMAETDDRPAVETDHRSDSQEGPWTSTPTDRTS